VLLILMLVSLSRAINAGRVMLFFLNEPFSEILASSLKSSCSQNRYKCRNRYPSKRCFVRVEAHAGDTDHDNVNGVSHE